MGFQGMRLTSTSLPRSSAPSWCACSRVQFTSGPSMTYSTNTDCRVRCWYSSTAAISLRGSWRSPGQLHAAAACAEYKGTRWCKAATMPRLATANTASQHPPVQLEGLGRGHNRLAQLLGGRVQRQRQAAQGGGWGEVRTGCRLARAAAVTAQRARHATAATSYDCTPPG